MYQWNLRRREKFKSLMISKWINWILVYSKSSLNKYIWIWKEPSVNWRFTADIWTDRRSVNFDKMDLFTQLTKQCRMTHPFANKECMYTRLYNSSSDDDFYENYSKYSLMYSALCILIHRFQCAYKSFVNISYFVWDWTYLVVLCSEFHGRPVIHVVVLYSFGFAVWL